MAIMAIIRFILVFTQACALDIPSKEVAPGVKMPVVNIGTGQIGSLKHAPASEILGNWLDLGGRGIDTAWIYFDQEEVAATIKNRSVAREDLFITTKLPECFTSTIGAKVYIESNLKKLNTTYIDLLLIHAALGECANTWSVMEDYHKRGVLRAIGVSNFGAKNLEGLLKTATVMPAVNQVEYNIYHHNEDTVQYCKQKNITVQAYSPLGSWTGPQSKSIFKDPSVLKIAAAHNVSAAQVALKWIVQQDHILAVLSANKAHQADDADLFNFQLSKDEMTTLSGISSAAERTSGGIVTV